jgi:hypothetical protein
MKNYRKILVVCPASVVTGGPEALHQLTAAMRSLDIPAFICYFPFSKAATIPDAYLHYNIPVYEYEDAEENFIIFPEIYPVLALRVHKATAAIWWLSLDNFLERRHVSGLHDKLRYLKRFLQGKRPWGGTRALAGLLHYSQTEYVSRHLETFGIRSYPLIDSINEDFLSDRFLGKIDQKRDLILYNPKKGSRVTSNLIRSFPNFSFIPIENLNTSQLSEIFFRSKIYIDFGHHPGRDRLPREAAMHGCCVITGKLGSAKNDSDVPLPARYKLDSVSPEFIDDFGRIASEVLSNFSIHYEAFETYRRWVQDEPRVFREQVKRNFEFLRP